MYFNIDFEICRRNIELQNVQISRERVVYTIFQVIPKKKKSGRLKSGGAGWPQSHRNEAIVKKCTKHLQHHVFYNTRLYVWVTGQLYYLFCLLM